MFKINKRPLTSMDVTMAQIATTADIFNIEAVSSEIEYSFDLPEGTKRFAISVRDGDPSKYYKLSFESLSEDPTAPYLEFSEAAEWYEDNLFLAETTIYINCEEDNKVIQIVVWR